MNYIESNFAHSKTNTAFLIRHTYEKGEYIFTAGSENLNMYIIESGSCTANMENYNGTMAFIGSYHSGDIFGELGKFFVRISKLLKL